ncbi:Zinc finger ZZ-type protein [Lasiodiplodia theobromae]|uniref:Zinc finger ZZ-type protein n=1 Tax=Lasiodiplodia theobromae TaxID=45133 RepID=UPI0015C332A9|nr:Zinc finger ZZ-type protein [Lasiodiplodia theobromae]KAF4536100.1 Zinc finger ZZ-type protein [Lasiodiplodia theobromae]
MVELLIKRGSFHEAVNEVGASPLYVAAREGHHEVVKLLLERGADVSSPREGGWLPIHAAAVAGDVASTRMLINYGADFQASNDAGATPLLAAIEYEKHDVAEYLLKRGADLHAKNDAGETPLYLAAEKGDEDLVNKLLKREVDGMVKTQIHRTTLFDAAKLGHDSFIDRLLQLELDVSPLIGHTAWMPSLNLAAFTGNMQVLRLITRDQRAESFSPDQMGRNALHLAARSGSVEAFDFLCDLGFDLLTTDHSGRSVLHYACQSKSVKMVRYILQLPTARELLCSKHEWTPLFWAARVGNAQLVTDLMLAGLQEAIVSTSEIPGDFSPFSLAEYHANDALISDENCPLKMRGRNDTVWETRGTSNGDYECDSCFLVSPGTYATLSYSR